MRNPAEFSQAEKKFPEAIVCHSAKKNFGEHKAFLMKEYAGLNDQDRCQGPCKELISSKV